MRRSIATKLISNGAPAVPLGLIMALLATSVIAAPETGSQSPASKRAAAIEPHDVGSDSVDDCGPADQDCVRAWEIRTSRVYLVRTAHPGGTMMRQGPEVAIERLHPEFALRLADAIREAREAGLAEAGLFSAYRPPAFGVGGFKNKFQSLHSYGLAVDMHGIGSPGSAQARLWRRIAAKHGVVCPYGVGSPSEWNHCQPTRIKAVQSDSPLVKTIAPQGPINPLNMFEAGRELIEGVAKLFATFGDAPATTEKDDKAVRLASHRPRRVTTADANSSRSHRHTSRQHRNEQHAARKGRKIRSASASGRSRKAQHKGHRHASRRVQRVS